jgi:phage shock protein E
MSFTTRNSRSTTALAALALTLAACGGGADDTASGSTAAAPAPTAGAATATIVDPAAGAALLASASDVTLVDVRTPAEFAEGHIDGAVLIDVSAADFDEQIGKLPRDGAYVVYCRSGNRSAAAAERMIALGFTEVYDLGGIGAWQAAGFPVVTG